MFNLTYALLLRKVLQQIMPLLQ